MNYFHENIRQITVNSICWSTGYQDVIGHTRHNVIINMKYSKINYSKSLELQTFLGQPALRITVYCQLIIELHAEKQGFIGEVKGNACSSLLFRYIF